MAANTNNGSSNLTDEEVAKYKGSFDAMDVDKDGSITVVDLKEFIKKMGIDLPDADLLAFIDLADVDNDGTVSWEEFLKAVTEGISSTNLLKARCRLVFADMDKDGSGYITPDELREVMKESPYHEQVTEADITKAMSDLDTDGDGRVSFEEFLTAVTRLMDD